MAAEPLDTLPGAALLLRPLEYVLPSRAAALRTCFLQVAFEADPFYRRLAFKGPRALLGTVCHALLDRTSRGEFASVPEAEVRFGLERGCGMRRSQRQRRPRSAR